MPRKEKFERAVSILAAFGAAALLFYMTAKVVQDHPEHKYWSAVPAVGGALLTRYGFMIARDTKQAARHEGPYATAPQMSGAMATDGDEQ
jgi:hypothetical protein